MINMKAVETDSTSAQRFRLANLVLTMIANRGGRLFWLGFNEGEPLRVQFLADEMLSLNRRPIVSMETHKTAHQITSILRLYIQSKATKQDVISAVRALKGMGILLNGKGPYLGYADNDIREIEHMIRKHDQP